MSEYFSDSAFGSQSDTKIELYNPWEDEEKMLKFRAKKIVEYEYDESECGDYDDFNESTKPPFDISKVAFMSDPPITPITPNTPNNNNKKEGE